GSRDQRRHVTLSPVALGARTRSRSQRERHEADQQKHSQDQQLPSTRGLTLDRSKSTAVRLRSFSRQTWRLQRQIGLRPVTTRDKPEARQGSFRNSGPVERCSYRSAVAESPSTSTRVASGESRRAWRTRLQSELVHRWVLPQ